MRTQPQFRKGKSNSVAIKNLRRRFVSTYLFFDGERVASLERFVDTLHSGDATRPTSGRPVIGRSIQGAGQPQGAMWSYVSPEARVPQDHPSRPMRQRGHGLDGAVVVLRPAVRYQGHVLIENRSGLIVANCVSRLHHGGMNEFGNRC